MRYSLTNLHVYINANLQGFTNILEACRHNGIEHLADASSSSVYGGYTKLPFSVHDNIDHPVSLYAVTKKANELMAHTYNHLLRLPTQGYVFYGLLPLGQTRHGAVFVHQSYPGRQTD